VGTSGCPNGALLRIEGEIQPDLAGKLERALASLIQPDIASVGISNPVIVELHSNGGNVFAAMEAGRVLRKARAWTKIGQDKIAQSNCASACSLLFIAGVNRIFHADWLDLHRPSMPSSELANMSLSDIEARNRELKKLLLAYADEMSVDRHFIEMSYSVPIDASIPMTEFQAREVNAAGMIASEYDFIKGRLVRELKLGDNADAIFAFYLGRVHLIRSCLEQAYHQAIGKGANPIDAALFGAYFEADDRCEKQAFKAYPLQNNLDVPPEAHLQLFVFAENS
jgi:hypothetical protein